MRHLFLFLLLFIVSNVPVFTQSTDTIASATIEVNNIKFNIRADGLLFYNKDGSGFTHQPTGTNLINGIGTWIGGLDPVGNIKAAIAYPNFKDNQDFTPGLLSAIGEPLTEYDFNKIWLVTGTEIEQHIADFEDNGIVDNRLSAVFGWPGAGNRFFAEYHETELPESIHHLAPFYDRNFNNQYEPDLGDYPVIDVPRYHGFIIPKVIAWFVMNDATTSHQLSKAEPTKMEIRTTIYAFSCETTDFMNNRLFIQRDFINKDIESLDGYVGTYHNFALGCPADYFGTIPELNTIYAYDTSLTESNCNNETTKRSPIVAATILTPTLNQFGGYNVNQSIPLPVNHPDSSWNNHFGTHFPRTPIQFYYNLSNRWADGSPLYFTSDGYGSFTAEETVSHLFDSRPFESTTWTEEALNRPPGQRLIILTEGEFRLDPRARTSHTMMYTIYPIDSDTISHQQIVEQMTVDIDSFVNSLPHDTPFADYFSHSICGQSDEVNPVNTSFEGSQVVIYPNPTTDYFQIEIPTPSTETFDLYLYNQLGELVKTHSLSTARSNLQISTTELNSGIYLLILSNENRRWQQKVVVL